MKRENLEFLEDASISTKEKIDKVMALHGQALNEKINKINELTTANENLTEKVSTYETKIEEFNKNSQDNVEWKTKYDELQASISEQEARKKAEAEEKLLNDHILEVFGDRKFTSDYAKNGLLNDIKSEVNKPENKGKGIQDIFNSLTKDKEGIFENPNKMPDMAGMGDSEQSNNIKEMPTIW